MKEHKLFSVDVRQLGIRWYVLHWLVRFRGRRHSGTIGYDHGSFWSHRRRSTKA